ncbi:capsid protein [Genomoviridae sp.]|nr:capsid protein [Genomoviridae sp.]
MAYRRSTTRRARAPRRYAAYRKKYGGTRRRYAGAPKRRTYRKRTMTRKRILDVTSRKKRDTMMPMTYNNALGVPTNTLSSGIPIPLQGGRVNMLYWCATARDLTSSLGKNTVTEDAARTQTSVYMRLLSERIRIYTSSASPWFWRRIVFSGKGPDFWSSVAESAPPAPRNAYIETSFGLGRLLQQFDAAGGLPNQQAALFARLFKGANQIDWSDPMTAPTDSRRVSVMYDKTTTIRSGNQQSAALITRRTHYFNKNLVYDDDETGANEDQSFFSVESKQGMGDVYIVDLFNAPTATGSELLYFYPEASLYWHEK